MSASPNNPNLGFHWHTQPRNAPPSVFAPMGGTGHEALQALLAFSALHEQVRRQTEAESSSRSPGQIEKFVLDEVLQLVSDRAIALTGANGVAIALEEGGEIICRASSGTIAPDKRAKLNPNSGFSGACFRTGQIIRCDDTEADERVNVQAARRLGTRSMVAVPLIGRDGTVGLIEAFSSKAYAFQDSNIRSLNLLAELILGAMKPEVQSQAPEALPLLPVLEEPSVEQSAQSQPVLETPAPWPTVEAIREKVAPVIAEPIPVFESQPVDPSPSSQLGLKIAVALVLLAIVTGAGIWWKLRTSQASDSSALSVKTSQVAQLPASPALSQGVARPGSDGPTAVTGIRHWSSPTSSTVVIDLQDNVRYQEHRLSDPDRIYFDLPDTTLDHKLTGKTFEIGDTFLVRVRVAQPTSGTTRVVLDTRNNPDYKVRLNQDPYRLEIEVHGTNAPAPPKTSFNLFTPSQPPAQSVPAPAPVAGTKAASAASLSRGEKTPVKTPVSKFAVVLDAGHGGWDEGTVGRRGLMEKDLALDIVARLGKLITDKLNGEVIYTRHDDTYIPLEKRAEIANLAQADFFVSIHANYSDTPSARGVETYYSNTYSSLNARIPGAGDSVKQVDWTNVDIKEKALQSQQLAASVQNALFGRIARENPGIDDRGVKKASYVVLTGTTMPAILTEVSFVSSPADENRLRHSAYRQQIADAIYKGIARFVVLQHKVTMASASSKPTAR